MQMALGYITREGEVIVFVLLNEQENLNSKAYLGTIKMQVLENLRSIQHAPSVQMQEVRVAVKSFLISRELEILPKIILQTLLTIYYIEP